MNLNKSINNSTCNFVISSELKIINPDNEVLTKKLKLIFLNDTNISAQNKKIEVAVELYNLQSLKVLDLVFIFRNLVLSDPGNQQIHQQIIDELKNVVKIKPNLYSAVLTSILYRNTSIYDAFYQLMYGDIFENLNKLFLFEKETILNSYDYEPSLKNFAQYKILSNNLNMSYKNDSLFANFESILSSNNILKPIRDFTKILNQSYKIIPHNYINIHKLKDTKIHEIQHHHLNFIIGLLLEKLFSNKNHIISNDEEYNNYISLSNKLLLDYFLYVESQLLNFFIEFKKDICLERNHTFQKIARNKIIDYLNKQHKPSLITVFIIDFICNWNESIKNNQINGQQKKHLEGFNAYGIENMKFTNTILDFCFMFISLLLFP